MNELTFLDLAVLHRVDNDTYIEKFGSRINTSFFETANLIGTMKIKGLVDFEQSIGGNSKVTLASKGKYVLEVAEKKSKEQLDNLDNTILLAISKGASKLEELQNKINIRSEDLAFHLEKLYVQSYIDYHIRSAEIFVSLTENGFNIVGTVDIVEEEVKEESIPLQEEMPKREIQSKLSDIEEIDETEDVMSKRARTKREFYFKKYGLYYLLGIILILIILGLIYLFFFS